MIDPRSAYREASARGIPPVQSVLQLYEQITDDLRQALKAIESEQVEVRTNKINHAILVIGYLQSRLDFDGGGKIAQNLDRFYNVLRRELLLAQFQASSKILSGRIDDLLSVREAWLEVARSENSASAAGQDVATQNPSMADARNVRLDWKG